MTPEEFSTLQKQAEAGDLTAMFDLALAYNYGDGTEPGVDQFFHWTKKAAEAGHTDAMLILALAYREGKGTEPDVAQFFHWIQKAADAEHADAMFSLAVAYRNGEGTDPDVAQYFHWIQKAADAEHTDGMYNLAFAYKNGEGTDPDVVQFFHWIQKAAEAEHTDGMVSLALAYREGKGTDLDVAQFFHWIQKAADAGNSDGMYNLALAYDQGEGTEPDVDQCFRWTQKAAKAGNVRAMYNLALSYDQGEGTEPDVAQYFRWTQKAAEAGNTKAMFNLALAYDQGEGTEPDVAQCFRWTQKAAEAGLPKAFGLLGFSYYIGKGVRRSREKAFKNLCAALEHGHHDSIEPLLNLFRKEVGQQVSSEKLFGWLQNAASAGIHAVFFELAEAFRDGKGADQNEEKYRLWLQQALDANDIRAFIRSGLEQDVLRDALEKIGETELEKAEKAFTRLTDKVDAIQKTHQQFDQTQELVAHFTRPEALPFMLPVPLPEGEPQELHYLRCYNIAYVNDPQEGQRLVQRGGESTHPICDFFEPDSSPASEPMEWKGQEIGVYVGSFTLRCDELDLWRAYGHDGLGYCMVIPRSVFSDDAGSVQSLMAHRAITISRPAVEIGDVDEVDDAPSIPPPPAGTVPLTLHRVLYKDDDVDSALTALKSPLQTLKALKKKIAKEDVDASARFATLVRIALSEILFLYKNKAYAEEKEVRILTALPIDSEHLTLDGDNTSMPRRVYARTEPFLFERAGGQIIVGPKVKDKVEAILDLKYRLSAHKVLKNTEVKPSAVPYR